MKIVQATRAHAPEISRLMLLDLKSPNPRFPHSMMAQFRKHAKPDNVANEFDNDYLLAYIAVNKKKVIGFIVGYADPTGKTALIHYVTAQDTVVKKDLLDAFVHNCQTKKIETVQADTFGFMDNNQLFRAYGFIITRRELLAKNLECLWFELPLKPFRQICQNRRHTQPPVNRRNYKSVRIHFK